MDHPASPPVCIKALHDQVVAFRFLKIRQSVRLSIRSHCQRKCLFAHRALKFSPRKSLKLLLQPTNFLLRLPLSTALQVNISDAALTPAGLDERVIWGDGGVPAVATLNFIFIVVRAGLLLMLWVIDSINVFYLLELLGSFCED